MTNIPRDNRPGDLSFRETVPAPTAPLPRPDETLTKAPEVAPVTLSASTEALTGTDVNRTELQRLLADADRVKLTSEGGSEPARALRELREGLRQLLGKQ